MTTAMHRIETREIGPLGLRASIVPDSFNEEARTVDLVWTTGARVERGFFDRFLEELSLDPKHVRMGRLTNGAPLLDAHDGQSNSGVIGVVESASLAPAEGRATVRFAKEDERAESIFRKVRDKIIRNVSVGYRVHKLERVEEEDGALPVMRATDWEPFEISMVPMGADAGAGVRSPPETNICEFIQPLAEETRAMPSTKKPATPSAPAATPSAQDAGADAARNLELKAAKAAAGAAERTRITAIERCAGTLDMDQATTRKAIDDEMPADEFRILAMKDYEERKTSHVDPSARPSVSPGDDQRDKWLRGAGDWLIQRSGIAANVIKAGKKRGEDIKIDPGEFRGLSMIDLARECLDRAGVKHRGKDPMQVVQMALNHRSFQTTSDFSVLLENTMNKSLMAAYELEDDTWRRFCAIGSVTDFRVHNRYRRGSFGTLDTVAEHGEFKHKITEDGRKETIIATTKGNLVAITRQALINDDMGAFNSLAVEIGQMAGLSIEVGVYASLAENAGFGPDMGDGKALFHIDHSNIGAGAALTTAALDANDAIMAAQQDDNENRFLAITPSILLVPRGLKKTALLLNRSEFEVDTSARKANIPNTVQGLFDDIVATPYLAAGTTRRYLFADPNRTPTLEVAFLNGQQAPFLEMREGWNIDGVEWKVRMDYGISGVDYKGALTDAGA